MQCSNTVKDKRIIAIGAKKSIDFGSAMKHQYLFVVFFFNLFWGESRKKSEKSKLIQQIFLSKNFVYVLPKNNKSVMSMHCVLKKSTTRLLDAGRNEFDLVISERNFEKKYFTIILVKTMVLVKQKGTDCRNIRG